MMTFDLMLMTVTFFEKKSFPVGCPEGQYKDSAFTCKLSPEKTVESAKDNTTQSNIGYELDEITDIPNNEHSRFGKRIQKFFVSRPNAL